MINSNSTDNSFKIVNNWIANNKSKIKFKNYNKNSYPSSSKNAGTSVQIMIGLLYGL